MIIENWSSFIIVYEGMNKLAGSFILIDVLCWDCNVVKKHCYLFVGGFLGV